MNIRLLTILALAILIGAFAIFTYVDSQRPVMSYTGRVQLETASHEALPLNNAIFIQNSDAPRGRIYLRFKDDHAMNDAIGKEVTVSGSLESVQLDDGESISIMEVGKIDYLPIKR